jgi:hypothetical protein
MEFKNRKDEIKKALLQGGLIVSGRCSGKTWALAEILIEDSDAVVIVCQAAQMDTLKTFLHKAGLSEERIKNQVIPSYTTNRYLQASIANKNVYVDEWSLNPYKGHFKAAVTSFHFPVKVIGDTE